MNDKISITNVDGAKVNGDLICFIETLSTGKRHVYYTLNETVGAGPNSTVKIYVSKIKQNNPALDTPITEGDWDVLKGYMSDALKGVTNPDVKYISPSELGEPVSISDRAIAMPTSYDYINKQRGIYAQSIATAPSTPLEATPSAPIEPAPSEQKPVEQPATPEAPKEALTTVPTPSEAPATAVTPEAPQEPTPVLGAQQESIAPVEPVPLTNPIEQPATPTIEEPPVPTTEPTPVTPVEPAVEAPTANQTNEVGNKLEPIDIASIENKYQEMIASINALKDKEIEAAKRYNATIELSTMHNEQHANYIQNEQIKEAVPSVGNDPQANVFDNSIAQQPVAQEPTPVTPTAPNLASAPAPQIAEPTPVIPESLETNWFDMPAS